MEDPVRPLVRLKPEFQKKVDDGVVLARPLVRLLTPEEREARERERTKDYRPCVLCQQRQPPYRFCSELPVCNGCKFGTHAFHFGSGKGGTRHDFLMIASATAVIRTLERTAWRMQRRTRT